MKKILNVLYWLVIIFLIGIAVFVYKTKYFNDYLKTMKNPVSSFSRVEDMPDELKNSGYTALSYKIESEDYNNALFYKTLETKKNTPYRVSCYVKTENVEYKITDDYIDQGINYLGGANISIYGENERSKILYGTNGWQKIEFEFNSKDRESVDIAFRLGTDMADAKGTAIFSNIIVEEGVRQDTSNWNYAVIIFNNIDVTVDGKHVKETINEDDLEILEQDIDNFVYSLKKMTKGKIEPVCTVYYVDETITSVSQDKDNGYYVDIYDVYEQINDIINSYDYDHFFFVFKSDDLNKDNENKTTEADWVGLGGMYYNSIGYSNIRLPITYEKGRHMFIYDRMKNTFPEEVFIHEFLHSLEHASNEAGYDYPPIHNYLDYGYKNDSASKLKSWYTDFLNYNITNPENGELCGLNEVVYSLANPVDNSDFEMSIEIEFDKEPENFIDAIKMLFKTIKFNISNIIEMIKNDNESSVIENNIYTNDVIVYMTE